MEDDIDMANHSIINLKDPQPSDASHAASLNYVTGAILSNDPRNKQAGTWQNRLKGEKK